MILKKSYFFIFGFLWKLMPSKPIRQSHGSVCFSQTHTMTPVQQKTAGENKKNGAFLTFPSSFVKTQF